MDFGRDAPDVHRVRWYECHPAAPALPVFTGYNSRNWWDGRVIQKRQGEVIGAAKPYRLCNCCHTHAPARAYFGAEDVWHDGATTADPRTTHPLRVCEESRPRYRLGMSALITLPGADAGGGAMRLGLQSDLRFWRLPPPGDDPFGAALRLALSAAVDGPPPFAGDASMSLGLSGAVANAWDDAGTLPAMPGILASIGGPPGVDGDGGAALGLSASVGGPPGLAESGGCALGLSADVVGPPDLFPLASGFVDLYAAVANGWFDGGYLPFVLGLDAEVSGEDEIVDEPDTSLSLSATMTNVNKDTGSGPMILRCLSSESHGYGGYSAFHRLKCTASVFP